MKILASILILLSLTACSTAPKHRITLNYPVNVTKEDAKASTILAFSNKDSKEWSNVEKMVDNALSAGMQFYVSPRDIRGWGIESVADNVIELGYTRRQHYLRCGVTYQDKSCDLEIIGSNNLKESNNRIHKNALQWLNRLQVILRNAFGQFSVSKVQNKNHPTVQSTE